MAILGLAEEDYAAENVTEVWPDNWDAVLLFDEIGTQWRCGPAGAYGLDYNVLFQRMDRMKLPPDEFDDLAYQIRILESAALEEMRKE